MGGEHSGARGRATEGRLRVTDAAGTRDALRRRNGAPRTYGRTWVEGRRARSAVVTWVPVSAAAAFAYVADLTRHNEWTVDEVTVTPHAPGPVQRGRRYSAVGRQRGKAWPSQLEVTVYEPPHRFEFTATGGPIGTPDDDPHRHTFLFTPWDGGTRIELRRTDPAPPRWPAWLCPLLGPLVRATLGTRITTVARLAARLDEHTMPRL